MPTQLGISGGAELRYVAGRLRKAAARDLTREIRSSQRKAVRPLQKEIKASALLMLPKRGGYAGLMAKDVKVSTRVGIRAGSLSVRIYAKGKRELRDIVAVNSGIIRHPGLGGRRSGRWYVTRVPRGFVDKPVELLQDRIVAEAADAVGKILTSIART